MPVERDKNNLIPIRNAVYKLKVNFIDILNFAIDNDFVNPLYTHVILRCVHKKLGKIVMGLNDITVTRRIKTRNDLFQQLDILDINLEDIKLELSYLEIRKKYNLPQLLIEEPDDEEMTDKDKIQHLMNLIQSSLRFPR